MQVGVTLPVSDSDGPSGLPSFATAAAVARAAQDGGLDSAWLADHFFYKTADGQVHGLHEAWTWLAGMAAVTSRITLGHLVACVEELAAVLGAYADLGVSNVMVGLEPLTVRSVERLAEAVRLQRAATR